MDLIKVTDGQAQKYTYRQFKLDNPRTSFPKQPSLGILAEYGVFTYTSEKPDHDASKQYALPGDIVQVGGKWVQEWTLHDITRYPDLASARAAMLGFINDLTKKITDQYPASEVSAWPSKAEAARAVIAGTARADQTTLIQDEADLVGATLVDQAAAIVAKAEVFEAIVAKVSGLRQVTDASLVAATTSAEREAVLEKAEVLAAALAEAYGLLG
jgi:molybdopterin synthase catalytic subunit